MSVNTWVYRNHPTTIILLSYMLLSYYPTASVKKINKTNTKIQTLSILSVVIHVSPQWFGQSIDPKLDMGIVHWHMQGLTKQIWHFPQMLGVLLAFQDHSMGSVVAVTVPKSAHIVVGAHTSPSMDQYLWIIHLKGTIKKSQHQEESGSGQPFGVTHASIPLWRLLL